jgi:predicted phage-related endonuclease
MSSDIKIPLIFCHLTKYISDTDAIKLSRINKFSYESLAKYVNLRRRITLKQLKKEQKISNYKNTKFI